MPTVGISWGDGTADTIQVTYSGAVGSSQMTVTSSPNNSLTERVKLLSLKDHTGVTRATLTVTQKPRARGYSIAYNSAFK